MLLRDTVPVWNAVFLLFLHTLISVPFSYAKAAQEPLSGLIQSNSTLLWGPYRPNVYFGVRPRLPRSLLTGLLWVSLESPATIQNNFRYTCEQHEGMAGYGWDEYDVRKGGRQTIHDTGNDIDLTIDFVKVPDGTEGGSWAARVKGSPRGSTSSNMISTVIFYAGMEGLGELGFSDLDSERSEKVKMRGQMTDLGHFDIDIIQKSSNKPPPRLHEVWDSKPLDQTLMSSMQVPPEAVWAAKNVIFSNMKEVLDGYARDYGEDKRPPSFQAFTINNKAGPGNFHITQRVYVGDFEFDIIFNSASSNTITSESLTKAITDTSRDFKQKFDKVLKPLAPFTEGKYTKFSQSLFSNLFGGIGYFYGDSLSDRSYAVEYDEDNEGFWEDTATARARAEVSHDPPAELFTSVPSRPFFPRGFLWDEGFHLIPIVEWDVDVTVDIIQSWFNLIDSEGWIAREQILGPEARSKVPQEFQVQYPHYANPPTLFMVIDILLEKINLGSLSSDQSAHLKSRLETLYPLLKRQYSWFRRTQFGDIKSYDREAFSTKEAYRWRGRTPQHILPSGLDDYPRPQPPHPGELHLDLISWVGMMSRSLFQLANILGETDDASEFSAQHKAILRNIDDLHWSSSKQTYCDATIDDYEEHMHVCHKGYISIFPFMTGLLPPSHANLPHILELISDPKELWSDYGIRSLSLADPFYGTAENYWRSPIWVNLNYLIIKNLLDVALSKDGPVKVKEQARKIYVDLRKNLVENVYNEWDRTGFAWEQYNPETGEGQRTQHFTGWTSLVVVIMKMPDLSGKDWVKHGEL